MEQFTIHPLFGGHEIHWYTPTNQTLWMAIAVLCIFVMLVVGSRRRSIVPTRLQSIGEVTYGFIYKMVEDITGKEGLKFFPYVMTIFMFVVFCDVLGLIPGGFATTSHFAITGTLALLVFFSVTIIGFVRHGTGFLGLFWVSAAPLALRPFLAVIELISYFVRPVSHSIRLGGNMMAGHAVIEVFAAFAAVALISPLSVIGIAAMYALDLLAAFVQAYVFTILTVVYLQDALHPHH